MCPDSFVPDPNSPEAEAQWRASVEGRLASLKQRDIGNQVLGYVRVTTDFVGLGAGMNDLAGLSIPLVVGTRRLLKLTGYTNVQKHVTLSALQFFIREGATALNQAVLSIDGVGDSYGFMHVVAIVAPSAGTHTYKLSMFVNNGTVDVIGSGTNQLYLLAEDIGLAPA